MLWEEYYDLENSLRLMAALAASDLRIELNPDRHLVQIIDNERNKIADFRPPLPFPPMQKDQALKPGDFCHVKITETEEYDLFGEVI